MTAPAMADGGWSNTEKGWVLHPSQVERNRLATSTALAAIDARQAKCPTCALCGQRARVLDPFGLCSKVKGEHDEWRAGVRADERSGR